MKHLPFFSIGLFVLFFINLCSLSAQENLFYYAFKDKIELTPLNNSIFVKYVEDFKKENAIANLRESSLDISIKWHNNNIAEISAHSEGIINVLKNKLMAELDVLTCQYSYITQEGANLGITDEILISFLPNVTAKQQDELYKTFNITVVESNELYQKLIVSKETNVINIANKIYESGLVSFSHPNFLTSAELLQVIPNDTYFNNQITCHNTGQVFTDGHLGMDDADIDAPEAWSLTTGSGNIIIAVLDEGVTSDHPDLPNTRQVRLGGSNFGDGDPNDPSPTGNMNHGNACAGVIAATMNNNQGIAGIAPNCRIMPIRIYNSNGTSIDVGDMADAIKFAVNNGADIISNSWAYNSYHPSYLPVIVAAIDYAVSSNCVVVFAAGNDADVRFPANVGFPEVITVGASDRDDQQSNYSPTSELIDIVAPSHRAYPWQIIGETFEMWSIDIQGDNGYNSWHTSIFPKNPPIGEQLPNFGPNFQSYSGRFGGTSHACPVVAGVAALVLSVNPNLTNLEVFNILTETADEVGGYAYVNGKSNQMGYGRVNAFSAVMEASSINISGASILCASNKNYILNGAPSGSLIDWSFSDNFTYVSGQGTSVLTIRSGNNYHCVEEPLIASIQLGSANYDVLKAIWLGIPLYSGLEPLYIYPDLVCHPVYDPIYATVGHPAFRVPGATDYAWEIFPRGQYFTIYEPVPVNPTAFITVLPNAPSGVYTLLVGSLNECGGGTGFNEAFEVGIPDYWGNCESAGGGGPGGWEFSMSPNPANTELEITAEPDPLAKVKEVSETYEIKIYNTLKMPVYQSIKTNDPTLRISLANLKEGVYFVYFLAGGEVEIKQLVINR